MLITIVGLAIGLVFCKRGSQNSITEADKENITKTSMEAAKALGDSKDWSTYVNTLCAENATVLMTNSDPIQGRDAITASWQGLGPVKLHLTMKEVIGNGDLAYAYGQYTLEILQNGMKDHGKFIEIWKKQADGKWQVLYDIFNTSEPVTGQK